MHFHKWSEFKYIHDGVVDYLRICKYCNKCEVWRSGAYYPTDLKYNKDWIPYDEDNEFLKSLEV